MWAEMRTFQLGVQMSRGVITPSEAARPLSDIIDTCLRALLNAAKAEFSRDNGEVPDGRMALVALGAAGRREFATGSPLKLLFVYDHGTPSSSLAIAPPDWYAQLLQLFVRLLRGLSPEGILYEPTPMQGLPNTNGPASSLARLEEYFDGEAGISDFRLLTHARVIEAEGDLGERLEIMRRRVLSRERDHRELKDEVMAARSRLPKGGPWQVERGPGGLMDLELAVESIQIMAGPGFPDVLVRGLVPTFEACVEHGLLDEEAGRELRDAATLWQNLDGFFRMTCADIFDPQTASPEQKATIAEISGVEGFAALPERMRDTAAKAAQRVDAILVRTAGSRTAS